MTLVAVYPIVVGVLVGGLWIAFRHGAAQAHQENARMTVAAGGAARRARRGVRWSIVGILALTVLELPPPIGFETRPQDHVSPVWLLLFLAILASELTAAVLIHRRPRPAAGLAMAAAVLNLAQVAADQLHLLQPESAPPGYVALELAVAALSLVLLGCGWTVWRAPGADANG